MKKVNIIGANLGGLTAAILLGRAGWTVELFDRLRSAFSEETIVVATAMGVFMIANNVFNDALRVEPEAKA